MTGAGKNRNFFFATLRDILQYEKHKWAGTGITSYGKRDYKVREAGFQVTGSGITRYGKREGQTTLPLTFSIEFQVQQFVNRVPKTGIYVVEMQSHRIGKQTASLLPFAVHLRVFEAMLTCLLPGLVIPFDPMYTKKHFCLPTGSSKKRAAVNLVESLFVDRKNEEPFEAQCEQFLKEQQGMGGSEEFVESFIDSPPGRFAGNNSKPLLQISPKFVNYFKSCPKKDDLSDCLLQALTFYDMVVEGRK